MGDGSKKATTHQSLVKIHVKHHGGDEDDIHRKTRVLTDNLDNTVGLDLNDIPSYGVHCPVFYHKWCLITGVIKEFETHTERMFKQVMTKNIRYANGILNSYAYKIKDHSVINETPLWAIYENRSNHIIKVTQNKYFGCTVEEI
jgi:hypothetical protein